MTDEIRDALEEFTPSPDDEPLDWGEVLRRAQRLDAPDAWSRNGHGAPAPIRRRRRWLPALAAAAAVACGLALLTPVGPAVGRTLGDFTGWLTGEPGEPAPKAAQEAFARSTRSWEGFPPGTELRRLMETKAAGATLTLYGFRGAGSLCLRLDATNERHSDLTCPPLSELKARAQPALVVGVDRDLGNGKRPASGPFDFPEPAARVTYGIVADGVDRIEIRRNDGSTSNALVHGDAFLDVDTKPAATRRVAAIWALTDGKRVAIPFVPERTFFGFPTIAPAARQARGPAKVERKLHGGAMRWLARRQPRGEPVPKHVNLGFLAGTFARLITPDPAAPERMVVSVRDLVCATLVGGRYGGGGCWPRRRLFSTAPFAAGVTESGQYVTLAGLASDDVARLVLFPGTGGRRLVPLHDNAYVIEAARSAAPLRLVGYDDDGRVIGVVTLLANRAPSVPVPARQPAPGATWRTVVRNATGEVFVIRAAPDGRCVAFRMWTGGVSMGCQPAPASRRMELGVVRSSDAPHRVLYGRTGASVARVLVTFEGGRRQTVAPRRGFVLAALGSKRPLDSIAGLDARGHRVAIEDFGKSAVVGGGATIHGITERWISFGVSPATAVKLRAQGKSPRLTSCRRTQASPPLAGYVAGVHVRYICRGGALSLIGLASKSTRWQDRTVWGRGRITALTGSSLTIRDGLARNTGGKPAALTCSFTHTSPPVAGYRRGEQVEVFCLHGTLTGLNRAA